MDVAELHANWSRERVAHFLDQRVLPALSDVCPQPDGLTLVRFAPRSALFRLGSASGTYAVKLWGPSTLPKHTADTAYHLLCKLRRHDPGQTSIPAPRPVAVLPELGTLVMEWIDAPDVRRTILRGDRERGLAGALAAFGWLQRFHASEPPVTGLIAWQRCLAAPLLALRKYDALIPDDDRPAVARALEALEGIANRFRSARCEFRAVHFDAVCANFLFDGTRAIGIDLQEARHDDPLIDFANLLVDADALLFAGTEVEPPLAIAPDLQRLVLDLPAVLGDPEGFLRLRLRLLSIALAKYGARLQHESVPFKRERGRYLAVAEALASDEFVNTAVDARPGLTHLGPGAN